MDDAEAGATALTRRAPAREPEPCDDIVPVRTEHEMWVGLWSHRPQLERFVVRILGDADAAEDVVAEVFVVAWRRRDDIPPETQRAIGWLHGTARNQVRNHVRGEVRRRRLTERATREAEVAARQAHDPHDRAIERLAAVEAWHQLPDADRRLLALVASGASPACIARDLAIDRGALAMRVMRARARLRARLSP